MLEQHIKQCYYKGYKGQCASISVVMIRLIQSDINHPELDRTVTPLVYMILSQQPACMHNPPYLNNTIVGT